MFKGFAEILTPAEAGKLIRRDPQTLANWRWAGKGPAYVRDGNRVLYLRKDLEKWVADRRVDPIRLYGE